VAQCIAGTTPKLICLSDAAIATSSPGLRRRRKRIVVRDIGRAAA